MRFKAGFAVAGVILALGFSPIAQARGNHDDSTKSRRWWKLSDKSHKHHEAQQSGVTVREQRYTGDAGTTTVTESSTADVPGAREGIRTGPYTYVFVGPNGKYDYYLDHYNYPYRYGASPALPPTDVYGYLPPEQAGGGPVLYNRQLPVSWSARREFTGMR